MRRSVEAPGVNLYVHIPFCSGKCAYCAFYSEPYSAGRADAYLDALERELEGCIHLAAAIETLYIGGGTPSTLSHPQWQRLIGVLKRHVDLSVLREWTIEANPGTVSPALAALWRENGVNRASLGVQSMHDATLARMGRRHNAAQAADTVALLRASGFERLGLDLIAGLPGVPPAEWQQTLENTLALGPDHLSVYAWSLEPGSHLHRQWQHGQHPSPEDAAIEDALALADRLLGDAGFDHYEISNYARPGQRCRHNINIWNGADYVGFGPAAASRIRLNRWTNTPDLDAYCGFAGTPPREQETLAPETDATERLIFRFRLSDPVALEAFVHGQDPAAAKLLPYWQGQLESLARDGLVTRETAGWHCTATGRRFADTIAEALLPPSHLP
jgi:oxygen-independent coproporphyrinogen-3 oxidase